MNKLLLSEPTKKYLKLVSWIALFLLISYSTSMITKSSINTWYVTLNRSFLTPPGYVFGLVWSILYIMIATAGWMIWNQKANSRAKLLKNLFIFQLILNWTWSPLFFIYQLTNFSIISLIVMIISTAILVFKSYKPLRNVSILMMPYLLWLTFALYLNIYIYLYN